MNGINDIGGRFAVGLRGIAGAGTPGGTTGQALNLLAGRVAATLSAELRLAPVDPGDRWTGGSAEDAYGIAELADGLARELGGGPADAGSLSRSLHAFVGEAAVLLAARPESASIERLQAALQLEGTAASPSINEALRLIDTATRKLADPA